MRKFFAPLILSLFFFLPFKVKADTFTYSDTDFDILQSQGFINALSWANANKPNGYPYIAIAWQNYNLKTNFEVAWFSSNSYIASRCDNQFGFDTTYMYGRYNPSTGVGTFSGAGSFYYKLVRQLNGYMYSEIAITCPANSSVTQVFDGITYTADSTNKILSLQDIVDYPRPTPDNTPLLTTFYSVVIEKIGDVCTFFTSNYLYLSVFVIFLFYISILLLRRFIK